MGTRHGRNKQGSATEVPATIEPAGGNSYIVYASLDFSFSNPGSTNVLVGVWDNDEYGPNPQGGGVISDHVIVDCSAAVVLFVRVSPG